MARPSARCWSIERPASQAGKLLSLSGRKVRTIVVAETHMDKKLTVYQKPTCSKCRATLRLLKERGVDFDAINYYETPLTEADLRVLLKRLGLTAREILRKDEPVA